MAQVKALIGNIKGKDGTANFYSTSETVIGTWNGSTLYRKMINIVLPKTTGGASVVNTYNAGVTDTSKVIAVYLLNIRNSGNGTLSCNSAIEGMCVWCRGDKLIAISSNRSDISSASAKLVIEYVK